jgi:hypothetical protein
MSERIAAGIECTLGPWALPVIWSAVAAMGLGVGFVGYLLGRLDAEQVERIPRQMLPTTPVEQPR